jgi:hypothetical protein
VVLSLNIGLPVLVELLEYLYSREQHFVNVVNAVGVTLERQIDERYLKRDDVFVGHVLTSLQHRDQDEERSAKRAQVHSIVIVVYCFIRLLITSLGQ